MLIAYVRKCEVIVWLTRLSRLSLFYWPLPREPRLASYPLVFPVLVFPDLFLHLRIVALVVLRGRCCSFHPTDSVKALNGTYLQACLSACQITVVVWLVSLEFKCSHADNVVDVLLDCVFAGFIEAFCICMHY